MNETNPSLVVQDGRCEARLAGSPPTFVHVELVHGSAGFARNAGAAAVKRDLLRAIGVTSSHKPLVLDAFAGLGRDGFAMAEAGCRVVMCERHGMVAALLADGLRRAREDASTREAAERVVMMERDAREVMREWGLMSVGLGLPPRPDVIYLDPMYPDSGSSASVKKESRLLRMLADNDSNDAESAEALELALHLALSRVVVKRPKSAPSLPGPTSSGAVSSKSTRWDIYGITRATHDGTLP